MNQDAAPPLTRTNATTCGCGNVLQSSMTQDSAVQRSLERPPASHLLPVEGVHRGSPANTGHPNRRLRVADRVVVTVLVLSAIPPATWLGHHGDQGLPQLLSASAICLKVGTGPLAGKPRQPLTLPHGFSVPPLHSAQGAARPPSRSFGEAGRPQGCRPENGAQSYLRRIANRQPRQRAEVPRDRAAPHHGASQRFEEAVGHARTCV